MGRRQEFPIVVVTRYAVNLTFSSGQFADPEWLAGRRVLFERYCLPYMRAQTDQRFVWLLVVDPETPVTEIEWLRAAAPQIKILGAVGTHQLLRRLRRKIEQWLPPGGVALTVRLDSDDSVAPDFLERMRAAAREALPAVSAGRPRAFGFTHGCENDTHAGKWAARHESYNQFLGLLASPQYTVLDLPHGKLHRSFDFLGIMTESPMWCTRVHGGNVGNQVFGAPCDPVAEFVW